MNTQNNKFTFNKKGFALSLACVGLLATAGNADIAGGTGLHYIEVAATGGVDETGYYISSTNVGLGGSFNVTAGGSGSVLHFHSSGAASANISQSGAVTFGGSNFTKLDLHGGASGSVTIWSGGSITLNNGATTVNLGIDKTIGLSGALSFSGGSLNFGQASFGTINLNNVHVGVSGGTINNSGTISNFKVNSAITWLGDTTSAALAISNSNLITNFEIGKGVSITRTGGTDSKGETFKIVNTGTITNFTNNGTLGAFTDTNSDMSSFITIQNNGENGTFKNAGLIDYVNINQNAVASGTVAGNITTFDNSGVISNSTISGGSIGTLTNAGTISNSTLQGITITNFDNKGTILNSTLGSGGAGATSLAGLASGALIVTNFTNKSDTTGAEGGALAKIENSTVAIQVTKSFLNAGIISSGAGAVNFALMGGARTSTVTAVNEATGVITGATFTIDQKILSFDNAGTINKSTIASGGALGGNIATFGNTGVISNSTIANITIGTLSNTGTGAEISNSTLNNLKIGTLTNTGVISTNVYLGNSGSITTLNNSGTFDVITNTDDNKISSIINASTGIIELRSGAGNILAVTNIDNKGSITFDSGAIIKVSGNTFEKPSGDIKNAGVIVGTRAYTLSGGTIEFNQFVNNFENLQTGAIDIVTLSNTDGDKGAVVNFKNAGTMTNIKTGGTNAALSVTHFTNTGYIGFEASGSLTLLGKTTGRDSQGSFVNSGTIGDLTGILARTSYSKFENSGRITTVGGQNLLVISGGSLDFTNSGLVELTAIEGSDAGTAIQAGASSSSGSRVTIVNTGELRLANRTGNHIDLTNFKKEAGVVTINEWHLTDIRDAREFNTTGNANLTDKVVVKGFGGTSVDVIKSTNPTTGKDEERVNKFTTDTRLRLNPGSIVIDPVKNPRIVAGAAYDLDKVVVTSDGAPVEALNVVRTEGEPGVIDDTLITNLYKAVAFANQSGQDDPRVVTISTLSTPDPLFVIQGVDKYDAYGNLVGITDIDTPIVGELPDTNVGSGGATTPPDANASGGANTGTIGFTTKKAEGDGIIDAFTIKVDGAKGAGAVAVKNAVHQTITRNAFINNVVTTAVNTALSTLNPMNRVASNDSANSDGVDFSKLEKYAQVTSDGAGYSYEKDTQVFVMPYFRSTSIDLETGDKLNGDTYGIVLGGQKVIAGNGGVLGLFLGYETGSADANYTDVDDDTMYIGANYYKTLGGTSTYDYYLKGILRLAMISSDVTRNGGNTESSDSTNYGIQAALGANIYNGIHTVTPEVAVSYDKLSVDGFKANGISYDDTNVNLPMIQLGVSWLSQFSNAVSTTLGAGFRYNLQDKFDARVVLPSGLYITKTSIDDFYFFLNAGVNFTLTPNWDLSVIYTGDFASDAEAHSGFLKIGYSW